ncbi:MAG: hypothetical protein J1F35_06410 [Erysipelotrichales bacterium]|nr:hypothetical protein [Erysipelotrichales bacterium]
MKYNLDFDVWKESPENWNERESKNIINFVSVCRVGNYLKFNKYGIFVYSEDDPNHWKPSVEEQEKFSRRSSNCMIFDITIPNCPYDKLFLYQYKSGTKGFSGYYIYSSNERNNHIHRYFYPNELNPIVLSLNRDMYNLDIKYNTIKEDEPLTRKSEWRYNKRQSCFGS